MGANLQSFDQISSTAIDLGMRSGPKLFVALLMLAAGHGAELRLVAPPASQTGLRASASAA